MAAAMAPLRRGRAGRPSPRTGRPSPPRGARRSYAMGRSSSSSEDDIGTGDRLACPPPARALPEGRSSRDGRARLRAGSVARPRRARGLGLGLVPSSPPVHDQAEDHDDLQDHLRLTRLFASAQLILKLGHVLEIDGVRPRRRELGGLPGGGGVGGRGETQHGFALGSPSHRRARRGEGLKRRRRPPTSGLFSPRRSLLAAF